MLFRIFCILLLASCIKSFAQSNINDKYIKLNVGGKTFKQLIQQLEKDYNINFSYSDNMLPKDTLPTKVFNTADIFDLLQKLFIPHGVGYTLVNNQIVLFKDNKNLPKFNIKGFVHELGSKTDIIGATLYVRGKKIGAITNSYGYYNFKIPAGKYTIQLRCLGYNSFEQEVYIWHDSKIDFTLIPKKFRVNEVTVKSNRDDFFVESAFQSLTNIDIRSLQELPGLFGENDALRNITLLPGIQSNEMSTGSVFVRGGSTEQTIFLMDEGLVYNPSHFGGFFSVFNPDVVNHVSVYKSELPSNETGALSSIVDVRLREGDLNTWKFKGGIGLISARASIEGPLKKDTSSILLAFRRSFVDEFGQFVNRNSTTKPFQFYFYDANVKFNYRLNDKNRIYLSSYGGADSFNQYSLIKRRNFMSTFRWNHVFNNSSFSNISLIHSLNAFNQDLTQNDEDVFWHSNINTIRLKADFSHNIFSSFKIKYGFLSNLFNIVPYKYSSMYDGTVLKKEEVQTEQLWVNSFYVNQDYYIKEILGIGLGARIGHIYNSPFIDRKNKYESFLFEPSVDVSLVFNKKTKIKSSYNHRVQPLHQLYLNMLGIAVNRWMPSSDNYLPQTSDNFSLGIFRTEGVKLGYSVEGYYRKMDNLIETLQEQQILYTNEPEKYLYNSSGNVWGAEFSLTYEVKKIRFITSYTYNKVTWLTQGINKGNPYPASHSRKHNYTISGVYRFSKRVVGSATWCYASGLPFTAPTGKYMVDKRVYLKFDPDKINTWELPAYHRLDLSLDIEGKKNDTRRWNSFWNFSIYNAYFHKNVLGVMYFSEDIFSDERSRKFDPNYFYFYQFVPSVSYRFNF